MTSTIDISPPPYALDDLSDLKDDIDLTNPTQVINLPPDFNLSKFQIDYLEAPGTRGSAKREIKNLAEHLKFLEDHFAKVSTEMEELDRAELIQGKNGKLILYLPKWQELHNVRPYPLWTSLISAYFRNSHAWPWIPNVPLLPWKRRSTVSYLNILIICGTDLALVPQS